MTMSCNVVRKVYDNTGVDLCMGGSSFRSCEERSKLVDCECGRQYFSWEYEWGLITWMYGTGTLYYTCLQKKTLSLIVLQRSRKRISPSRYCTGIRTGVSQTKENVYRNRKQSFGKCSNFIVLRFIFSYSGRFLTNLNSEHATDTNVKNGSPFKNGPP